MEESNRKENTDLISRELVKVMLGNFVKEMKDQASISKKEDYEKMENPLPIDLEQTFNDKKHKILTRQALTQKRNKSSLQLDSKVKSNAGLSGLVKCKNTILCAKPKVINIKTSSKNSTKTKKNKKDETAEVKPRDHSKSCYSDTKSYFVTFGARKKMHKSRNSKEAKARKAKAKEAKSRANVKKWLEVNFCEPDSTSDAQNSPRKQTSQINQQVTQANLQQTVFGVTINSDIEQDVLKDKEYQEFLKKIAPKPNYKFKDKQQFFDMFYQLDDLKLPSFAVVFKDRTPVTFGDTFLKDTISQNQISSTLDKLHISKSLESTVTIDFNTVTTPLLTKNISKKADYNIEETTATFDNIVINDDDIVMNADDIIISDDNKILIKDDDPGQFLIPLNNPHSCPVEDTSNKTENCGIQIISNPNTQCGINVDQNNKSQNAIPHLQGYIQPQVTRLTWMYPRSINCFKQSTVFNCKPYPLVSTTRKPCVEHDMPVFPEQFRLQSLGIRHPITSSNEEAQHLGCDIHQLSISLSQLARCNKISQKSTSTEIPLNVCRYSKADTSHNTNKLLTPTTKILPKEIYISVNTSMEYWTWTELDQENKDSAGPVIENVEMTGPGNINIQNTLSGKQRLNTCLTPSIIFLPVTSIINLWEPPDLVPLERKNATTTEYVRIKGQSTINVVSTITSSPAISVSNMWEPLKLVPSKRENVSAIENGEMVEPSNINIENTITGHKTLSPNGCVKPKITFSPTTSINNPWVSVTLDPPKRKNASISKAHMRFRSRVSGDPYQVTFKKTADVQAMSEQHRTSSRKRSFDVLSRDTTN